MNDLTKSHLAAPTGQGNAAALAAMANPSNSTPVTAPTAASPPATRKRIPMSIPRRKLEVDPIPGYVLYWFKDSNVAIAQEAGYEFVETTEVRLSQQNPANSADSTGNTDLGSKVTVIGNKMGEFGRPDHLVLMKIREEFWREDRQHLDNHNASIIEAIFGPEHYVHAPQGQNDSDKSLTYVSTAKMQSSGRLFNRGVKSAIKRRGEA